MARLEWAQLCEMAFLDSCNRLCLIGVTTRFPVPSLPLAVHHLMFAGRVVDIRPGEEIDVEVAIATPNKLWTIPNGPEGLEISLAAEYVFITLRDLPLTEEGMYRFVVSLGAERPLTLDIPVLLVVKPAYAEIH